MTSKQRKRRRLRNRLLFAGAVGFLALFIYFVVNTYTTYDYDHLTMHRDFGAGTEFVPLSGVDMLGAMVPAAQNDYLILYVNPADTTIAVLDKRNNQVWSSIPMDVDQDPIAIPYEKDIMKSLIGFRYYDGNKRRITRWTYADAAKNEQFNLESIPNGLRILYDVGDMSLGINATPKFISIERFEERIIGLLESTSDQRFLRNRYRVSETHEGFMEMPEAVRTSVNRVNEERHVNLFYETLGYTLEELEEDNEAAGYEFALDRTFYHIQVEFVLDRDTLILNIPLEKFRANDETSKLFFLDIMRYFGAGSTGENGYIFVPSGSGALIDFNNGKVWEDGYAGSVYGIDMLMTKSVGQTMHTIKLPVFGIKRDETAMVAWVENGASMASINADISEKISSYNNAYFNFLIRDNTSMTAVGGSDSTMLIIQPQAYEGDLTIRYNILAGDDADYVGMARAYQKHLIEKGDLTPITNTGDIPFYLEMIGGIEKRAFIIGTPYEAIEAMTTYKQASDIVGILNQKGVNNIHMSWQGWFNRGINHDVAKGINWLNKLGSKKDMQALDDKLKAGGGALYPAVNIMQTRFFQPKKLNMTYEVVRDPAGLVGAYSTFTREFLHVNYGNYPSDLYYLVNPIAIPLHLDKFIPAFDKLNISAMHLNDMGNILTGSIYRRDYVDRQHSSLIAKEQMLRLKKDYNLMISGGNDYALSAADHLINVPTIMDRFYILDHEVPFYQIVVHGFIDYAGSSVNTKDVQDVHGSLLNMLATGAYPHYAWSHAPARNTEFTAFEVYYSTQYEFWLEDAVRQYKILNEIFKDIRTKPITAHAVLSESDSFAAAVTVTEYGGSKRIYVNTTPSDFFWGDIRVPAKGYYVEDVTR